jgi:excisionase family DNA binding protein
VSKKEAAGLLGLSVRTIERLLASGRLTKIKVLGAVRIRLSELEQIASCGSV